MPLDALFSDIPEAARQQVLSVAEILEVEPGATIIAEFDTTDSMYVLEAGTVKVHAGGAVVASLDPGVILGEIGLFTLAVRTASVVAATPCRLLALSRDAFDGLRDADNPVAYRIERRALTQLAGRLRGQIASIQAAALAGPGLLVPLRPEPSVGAQVPLPVPAINALLGTVSVFGTDARRGLRRLGRGATLRTFEPSFIVSDIAGDERAPLLLLEGRIDAVARVPDTPLNRGVARVAAVDEGALFNILPAIDGGPRGLLYVARRPTTVIRLDGDAAARHLAADDLTGSVLRQAIIRSLFGMLTQAMTSLEQGHHVAVDEALTPGGRNARVDASVEDGEMWDAWYASS